jgi:hypothetical protein
VRLFNLSDQGATYVSEGGANPKDKRVLKGIGIMTAGAVAITAIIVGGTLAILVVGGVAVLGIILKETA